ncbi:MAG: hypothetical protein EOM67_15205 [Spirochaetia bacterium]|nr:hypothetical protein [Spirochaetia bacterium]
MVDINSYLNDGVLSIPAQHYSPQVQNAVLQAQANGKDLQGAAFTVLQEQYPDYYNKQAVSNPVGMNESPSNPNTVSLSQEEYNTLLNKAKILENPAVVDRIIGAGMNPNGAGTQAPNPTYNNSTNMNEVPAVTDPFNDLFNNTQSMSQTQNPSNPNPVPQVPQSQNENPFTLELQRTAIAQGVDPKAAIDFASTLGANEIVMLFKEVERLKAQPQTQSPQAPVNLVEQRYPSQVPVAPSTAFGQSTYTKSIFD